LAGTATPRDSAKGAETGRQPGTEPGSALVTPGIFCVFSGRLSNSINTAIRHKKMWLFPLFLLWIIFSPLAIAQTGVWRFAVSGDSRNCGDVVMPAIAQGVHADNAQFYWHLGDFRAIYRIDQDYAQTHQKIPGRAAPSMNDYLYDAWNDFIESQLLSFGDTPVFLAIGNHEMIPPKDHYQIVAAFADWLNASVIRSQRLQDDSSDHAVRSYYHWLVSGIDFVTLDNSSERQFEPSQMSWLKQLLDRDAANSSVRAVVLGMHAALPDSISADHSMNQTATGTESGRTVSDWLAQFKRQSGKPVYILASHSHFYMDGIFNTAAWRDRGVLPGWIVGSAGAERYKLPPNANDAKEARAYIYGYLLATVDVSKKDPIHFEFRQLSEADVPSAVVAKYSRALVHDCWVNNPPH
jgi:hypothetical protein